jgi:hypothetical protein
MSTTMYMYNLATGEYLGSRPAQVVGGVELTESSTATPIAPPADIPDGHIPRWTGVAWETVEDHRQHMDDAGTKQCGTPYWLPGDTHTSPARYMEDLGPLPDGALLEQPAAPPPTPEEIAAARKAEILARLAAIDADSVRPLRAIANGEGTDFDTQKLAALDAEAAGLRDELAGL